MSIQTIQSQSLQYHFLKTEHKDFITGACMIPMGSVYGEYEERHLPSLVAAMLSLGTLSKDEEMLHTFLESRGIQMNISAGHRFLHIQFTCLTKCLDETIALIAEQLQEPKFDEESYQGLKKRTLARYQSYLDDTGYRAQIAFTQALFPKGHTSRLDDLEDLIALVKKTTINDVKAFYEQYTNFSKATWVFVGDLPEAVQGKCEQYMPTNQRELVVKWLNEQVDITTHTKKIDMKDKQSIDLKMGHVLPIDRKHPDYLPLMLGIDALGGSFSARLMRTVRDEDGLTYNVGSSLTPGLPGQQCYWSAQGSFAPSLLEKGQKAIMAQLVLWLKGLTQAELDERKTGLLGKYQVALADARSISHKLTSNIGSGFDAEYLYTFCEAIEQVKLADVNRVIDQYIQLDKMTVVSAGTFSQ